MEQQKTINIGFDPGNGFAKLSVYWNDKFLNTKIPNGYTYEQPHGQYTSTAKERKLKAFSLLFGDEVRWFGQDILAMNGKVIRQIDDLRFDSDRLSMLFKAALVQWALDHKINLAKLSSENAKLHIRANVPPQKTDNRSKYVKSFRGAFNLGSTPNYIRDTEGAVRITTHFPDDLYFEGHTFTLANTLKSGYVLIVDFGYGTVDFVLMKDNQLIAKDSIPSGLFHMLENSPNPNLYELEINRTRKVDNQNFLPYISDILLKTQTYTRKLEPFGGLTELVLIGGTTNLFSADTKGQFNRLAPSVRFLNEYTNAESLAKIGVNKNG